MFGKVSLVWNQDKNKVILIPTSAIIEEKWNCKVYVIKTEKP